nr:UV DNA damage repair endonuclease UvsE [uncultured Intestinibacter sp.]
MKIRLGYVAISNALGKKVTSSSNVTYKTYSKLNSQEKRLQKLKSITSSNFDGLEKIIRYNIENDIHFYRITSALIPLTTHPEVPDWGYRKIFKRDFEYIGKLIRESNMRVDTHPDQFNVINSANEEVVQNTIRNLLKQEEWFEDMNYPEGKMVIHVGGATGGKEKALERFINNFAIFPETIQNRLIIENDDKIYTARETLDLCNELKIPMVVDIHHHNCNNDGENIYDMLKDIFDTWKGQELPPKIHFSSPREGELDRKHADYIYAEDFVEFLENIKVLNTDFDVMLECKEKDIALFKLVDDIKKLKPEYNWIDKTTLSF